MFTKKDRAFIDSALTKAGEIGEKFGITINKGSKNIIRWILISLGLAIFGGGIILIAFLKSSVGSKK